MEVGGNARARRYAWLQDILFAARHAGLADDTHRRLLLSGLPRTWLTHLPRRYPPVEQLAFDVCVLAHLPRANEEALLPLSLWLRNAHVLVHPLSLASFFQEAVDVHEAKGPMPVAWLPFPDTPYDLVDRAAYRAAQERADRPERRRNGRAEADATVGGSPDAHRRTPTGNASSAGTQDGAATTEIQEACPYCGSRSLPLYDFYLGRSCIPCFIDREEALQKKLAEEQSPPDPWGRST